MASSAMQFWHTTPISKTGIAPDYRSPCHILLIVLFL
jgi:hypothetical protein